jgi:hypothetical protein
MVAETGTREKQRPSCVEESRVQQRNLAARLAEHHQHPARPQAVQAHLERGLADRVVDDVYASLAGDALHRLVERLFRVEDDVVRAGGACDLGLRVGRDRADDARAEHLRRLHEKAAGAAGGRMHEAGIALLQRVGRMREVMRRHPLKHHGRGVGEADAVGDGDQARGRHDGVLGVRTALHRERDAITWSDLADVAADRLDGAGPFVAQGERKVGLVEAGPVVHVEKVHAAGRDAHERLAGTGLRRRHVRQLHLLGASGLTDLDAIHGGILESGNWVIW